MKFIYSKNHCLELVITKDIDMNFNLHNHISHYVISVVLEGNVNLKLSDSNIDYHKNEAFVIAPYVAHSVLLSKNSKLISLCVGTKLLNTNTIDRLTCIVKAFLSNVFENNGYVKLNDIFINKLNSAYKLNRERKFLTETSIYNIAEEIIKMPEREFSLENTSKTLFLSKYYFIRKFKDSIGMTPHQFLLQEKIRRSQLLLADSLTIVEVSNILGFYDQSHFSKCFKKIVGISPNAFIKSRFTV